MDFQELEVLIDILHQSQALNQEMHRADPTAIHGRSSLRHFVTYVAGLKHGAGLVVPVLGLKSALDSLLAIPKDLGIGSIHSKWPSVDYYVRSRTCFSPHIDGHFEFFVQQALKNHA
jgi:hypothetical protein